MGAHPAARDAARAFLRELFAEAKRETGRRICDLFITVPVDAYEGYRAQLEEIVRSLGVRRLRFVDEPLATALGYGLGLAADRTVLVVDIGGGTRHVALARLGAAGLQLGRAEVAWRPSRAALVAEPCGLLDGRDHARRPRGGGTRRAPHGGQGRPVRAPRPQCARTVSRAYGYGTSRSSSNTSPPRVRQAKRVGPPSRMRARGSGWPARECSKARASRCSKHWSMTARLPKTRGGQARRQAMRELDRVRYAKALGPLCVLLERSDPRTAATAAEALGSLGDARAERTLLAATESDAAELRIAAATALRAVGSVRAVEPLLKTLETGRLDVGSRQAIRGAIDAIQSRLAGAEAGQVSLASQAPEEGRLSLATPLAGPGDLSPISRR